MDILKTSLKKHYTLFRVIQMLIFLWLFLLSIKLLGEIFKHYFADNTASLIQNAANDPFTALFIGIITTALMCSSSTTTSIIVAFVGAGTLSFESAVPMIMGANIGSSITCMLVAFGQVRSKIEFPRSFAAAVVHDIFNCMCVLVFFPLEVMTGFIGRSAKTLTELLLGGSAVKFNSPLDVLVKSAAYNIENTVALLLGNPVAEHTVADKTAVYPVYDGLLLAVMLIIALALLFTSLRYMSATMKKLLIGKFERILHKFVFRNFLTAFIFGLLFTLSVQSSGITISLIVPLAGAGIVSLDQIFPYAVGSNIGTTITGILASMVTGNPAGISIALSHTLFNFFGAIVFVPLKMLPIGTAGWFAEKVRKNRLWAVGFLAVLFFILPAIIIFR